MGHATHTAPGEEKFDLGRFRLLQLAFATGAGIGLLGILITLLVSVFIADPQRVFRHFAHSYLFAYMVGFTIVSGSLFWVLLHHAVDAAWSVVVRRILEHMALLSVVLLFLFLPLAWFIWVQPLFFDWSLLEWWTLKKYEDLIYDWKAGFLEHWFFSIRVVLYFATLIGLAYVLRHYSMKQDKVGDEDIKFGVVNQHTNLIMRKIAYPGIVFFALALTFAAIDWLMALNHHWFSTMWGVYIFAGCAQSSMALLIIVSNCLRNAGYLNEVFTVEHNHIMGKLLFAFTVFWAYVSFSQYMLIYYANIPEETIFYSVRNFGSWNYYSVCLVIFHFILPFLALLTQPAKWDQRRLMIIAGFILLMHILDIYWVVLPHFDFREAHHDVSHMHGFAPHFFDIFSLFVIVGVLGFFFMKFLTKGALFPHKDPRLFESVTLTN
ncbi:MAG: hypothetical protein AAGA18_07535 [Verrucomicrobiota bacterium]